MECQRRVALWCSVGVLIFSVILLSLYFSCMGVCDFQQKTFYAPIWTAVLCIALTVFGFVIAFKKRKNVIGTAFATGSVICMICSLVCIYLIIGALIGERKRKSENDNYMTAMFLWIAMAGATGIIFIFTTVITCGFLCCQQCNKDENANTNMTADRAWSTTPGTADYVRDPPYAPQTQPQGTDQSGDDAGAVAPTAPPLFMSVTLQRETMGDMGMSADRRSFSANLVEMHKPGTSIEELTAELNEYTEMPSFAGREEEGNSEPAQTEEHTEEVETNVNNSGLSGSGVNTGFSVRYSEIANGDVESPTGNGESAITESEVTNDNTGMENHYAEITTNPSSEDGVFADREKLEAPNAADGCAVGECINNEYDYATTELTLVKLPSLEEDDYVNNSLPRASHSPVSLSSTDISFS